MTPAPGPTQEQKAVELEAAADVADAHGDFLFARAMRERAVALREAVPAAAGLPNIQ